MARPATGQVIERVGKRGKSYAIRFTTPAGERRQVRLGRDADGWTPRRAEEELQAVLADLRRGRPNELAERPEARPDPLFAIFAHEWFEGVRGELQPNTVHDYEWQITKHLLPYFGALPLSAITVQEVDRYRQAKVREADARRAAIAKGKPLLDDEKRTLRPLSATSINKTITRLAQILEAAVEYGVVDRNAARGKRRRLKAARYRGTFLDSTEAITALLDAAGTLDDDRRHLSDPHRRALVAVLVFAGLRINEALSLRWRQVSLPAMTMRVGSKTDAGQRTVDLLPVLVDELLSIRALSGSDPDALVFGTASGARQSPSNVRTRLFAPAITAANKMLEAADQAVLPEPLTPHSLRRTFISILLALGHEVPYVMEQAGHADPKVTLGIYARVMRRTPEDRARLKDLVEGTVPARFGASGAVTLAATTEAVAA
jgi:integrase